MCKSKSRLFWVKNRFRFITSQVCLCTKSVRTLFLWITLLLISSEISHRLYKFMYLEIWLRKALGINEEIIVSLDRLKWLKQSATNSLYSLIMIRAFESIAHFQIFWTRNLWMLKLCFRKVGLLQVFLRLIYFRFCLFQVWP